jgi:glycosyltransferase 2 family protein
VNESQATNPIESAPPGASARGPHRYLGFFARAGLGVGLVAFLLWHYDARPVLRILARENLAWFAATVVLYVAGQVMSAYRWQLVAALVHVEGRFSETLAYYFVGLFTNLFVPGLVGGDAARTIYLGRKHQRMGEAVASVVADRGIGLIALFWLAAAMALANRSALPAGVIRPTIVVGAVALAGYFAAPLVARLVHVLPRRLRRAGGIVLPYLHRPAALIPAILLSLALQISLAICQWMLARGLGLDVPITLFLLIVPIANVFASLPVTLNGLGVRETAYLLLFGMAGVGHNDAIALGLLWFAATMLGGLTGAIAFLKTPVPARAH